MKEKLLEHIHAHTQVTPAEASKIATAFKHRAVVRQQSLLSAGEVCRYESFVLKGCFYMYHVDSSGITHVAGFGVENWYMGDFYSFMNEKPSYYFITALEDSEVLQIAKTDLEQLLSNIPGMERYYRVLFQNAYIANQARAVEMISIAAEERYKNFLKRYRGLQNRVPQYLIASYLGITPQFLSKIRKKMTQRRS